MDEFTYEYLPLRGINKTSLKHYDVKTKIDDTGKPVAIGFRYPNGSLKIRTLADKNFYTEGEINKAGLFGMDKFAAGSHKCVTITEGELDALSLYQVTHSPVVSVQSSATAVRDCANCIDYLRAFDTVYLAFDGDGPGRTATASVAKLFDYSRVYDVKFTNRKDANEYLQADEATELLNIWKNSKRYVPDVIVNTIADFKKILSEPPKWGTPYPFHTLTKMTYGIRPSETVLITGTEGIGKTELLHAIEYKILTETDDDTGIGAFFLEEPRKRHLQALAGIRLQKPVHLPDCSVSEGEVAQAIQDIVRVDERLNLFSHFGSSDPEVLLDTIRFLVSARNCRYIFLDHIGLCVSGNTKDDERKILDYLATKLEMMVKELEFALILVSHVNDNGETRGSRYIGKMVDVRIDLSRNLKAFDPAEKDTMYITVSKNRDIGPTGDAGGVIFDLQKRRFKELTGGFDVPIPDNDNNPLPQETAA